MKITGIQVREYGPLRDFSLDPGDFDIVFGLNEAGKTALVEVLAYVLFRKTAANLRYDKPVGAVIEMKDEGRTYRLPDKRLGIELPAGDVANLLYVQASESTVFDDRGTSFWDGVKSMLSRVDVGIPFTKLDEHIFNAVELQPVKEEWTRTKQTKIDDDRQRKEALGAYLEKIGAIGKREAELSSLVARNDYLQKQIEEIDRYKAFRNYGELVRLYNSYAETKTMLQDYGRCKHDYLNEWQRLDIERKAKLGEGQKVKEIELEAKDLERKKETLEGIEQYVADEGLKNCCSEAKEPAGMPSMVLPLILVFIAAIAATFSLASRMLLVPSLILLAGTLSFLIFVVYRRKVAKKILLGRQDWLQRARRVFPEVNSLDELSRSIAMNEEELIKTKTLMEEKARIIDRMTTARSADVIEGEISQLRAKTGLAEISDLEVKLAEKRNLENELNKLVTRLSGLLQETDPKKWERMISARKTTRPESEPDISAEKDLIAEKKDVQHRIDESTRAIKLFRDVEQARFGISDDHSAFVEFDALDQRLRDYELQKQAALKAREILKSMSSELDEFIGNILHGKDSLSDFIGAITERYQKVLVENENFVAEDRSGVRYALDDLSSGTKDQLLLCFRMAALSKVYPKGTFMILDDAFIFADWQRRERLARLVRDFVERGNQVLYLTSDDHTRDLFAAYGARIVSLP